MTILNSRGNNSSRHRLYVIPPAGSNVGSVIGTLPDIHVLLTSVPFPKVVSPATNQETPPTPVVTALVLPQKTKLF